ncbi:MAG: glycosyltransferase [bacterium]|nr:glycosyltransferase [bacterium]
MTACWFGTYDRGHSANRLLRAALAEAGFVVEELHAPLWEATRDKDRRYFGAASLATLGRRWTAAMGGLARRWRARTGPPPLVVAGFGGQLDVLAAQRICRPRAALLFAPLVSLTETLVDDRRVFAAHGLRARAVGLLDRATLRAADLVLADTAAHAAWYAELGASAARLGVWHFGVEPEFRAAPSPAPEPGRVLFYGRGLPLHGLGTIVAAAARLGARASVTCIGTGPERARAEAQARALGAAVTWRDEIPLAELPGELARASVVLGVFGGSRKAAVVVPNKVYQAAAAGRPLVTRDGPGLREVLVPDTHCLAVPPDDPVALAAAVARLLDDRALAERLGAAARAHALAQLGPTATATRLGALLAERLGLRPASAALVGAG